MLKTGLIVYGLDRALGGIGRYTCELLQALQHMEHKPVVLRAGRYGRDVGTISLPGSRLLPGLLTLGQAEIAYISLKQQLALIHDPTGVVPLYLTSTAKVATIHDVVPYIYPDTSSRLDWLIYRIWLPLAVHRLDAIITDSHQSKADIVASLGVNPERVTVIPCAANAEYRCLKSDKIQGSLTQYSIDSPYILYVGSIAARKNLPRLLEAYAQLRKWSTRWKFIIVGARKWRSSSVYETVERLGLSELVQFLGYVAEEDLPSLYSGADLFVFPSLYEGFGLPVLEAMACGTPVVTSNSSSLPEVSGDAALLVDPYNVEEIAEAMRRVLADPALAQDLSERGLGRAAQFSWERTARETIAVYEKVLEERDQGSGIGDRKGDGRR